ncbi:unnamed protein product [Chilo suppressalis]|uniref:Nose resistant-to-fluoxetine protein N-terminal domain-containing protein n=1 Tax=Chilo suppressalis TaxID=168631 RepID=A0ABN8B142_CHISP|nr:unnamed protein product [Chilo suppressalis]
MDGIVYSLKTENWTNEELPCLNETLRWIRSLQNFTTWAVWEWDSVSSQPLGILSGNRFQLGNFDQCMSTPWDTYRHEIKTQYCLVEVALETAKHVKKKTLDEIEPYGNVLELIQHETPHFRPLKYLTWGACVPACCQPQSVERLVRVVLSHSHLGAAGLRPRMHIHEACQTPDESKTFDGPFYAFVVTIGILCVVCIVCTIINNKGTKNVTCNAFCLVENSKDLLKMKKDGIEVIYGIRFLTICGIVMLHLSAVIDAGPVSNGIKLDEAQKEIGWFVLHDDLLVDTFFLISAFLLAKGILEIENRPSVVVLIVRRYVRLVVGLAMVIFFLAAIFEYTGSGPLWHRYSDVEVGACRENWWLNLLMLSNYINVNQMCHVVTWYTTCDFHYYVIVVIVFALYKRCSKLGVISAIILTAASVIIPGVVNYANDFHPIQLFTYEFRSNPRGNLQFSASYMKSHTRAASYAVGFFAGCLFVKYKGKGNFRISQARSLIYVCAAFAIMLIVPSLGVSYLHRSYYELEGHLYAALNRPIWAAGVALLILTCSFGQVPLVTGFLKWYPWVPLSRLAYGIYLVHFHIIFRNVAITRNPEYYDNLSVFISSLGVICLSILFALLLWLFIEAPANKLLVLLLKRRTNEGRGKNGNEVKNPVDIPSDQTSGKTNNGYIDDNFPNIIQFSKL